jgi:hypothetical protein
MQITYVVTTQTMKVYMNTTTQNDAGKTNLFAMLWEASEEGEVYECTAKQIESFIEEAIGEDLSEPLTDVEVDDSEVNDWIARFIAYLNK